MTDASDLLSFVTVESPDAVSGSRGFTGCLLHGFGASAQDLVSLAPALGTATRWIVPHAPIPITVAGMSYGRAWFPRESDALEQALFGSYFQDLRGMEPPGLRRAAEAVRRLVDTQGISWNRVILGGFSQGAMVVAEILRQSVADEDRPLPAAAVLFSGALIAERWWDGVQNSRTQTVPVFQSHGNRDRILPVAGGRALADTLETAGFTVVWKEFDGAHEIPLPVHRAAATFLENHLRFD